MVCRDRNHFNYIIVTIVSEAHPTHPTCRIILGMLLSLSMQAVIFCNHPSAKMKTYPAASILVSSPRALGQHPPPMRLIWERILHQNTALEISAQKHQMRILSEYLPFSYITISTSEKHAMGHGKDGRRRRAGIREKEHRDLHKRSPFKKCMFTFSVATRRSW